MSESFSVESVDPTLIDPSVVHRDVASFHAAFEDFARMPERDVNDNLGRMIAHTDSPAVASIPELQLGLRSAVFGAIKDSTFASDFYKAKLRPGLASQVDDRTLRVMDKVAIAHVDGLKTGRERYAAHQQDILQGLERTVRKSSSLHTDIAAKYATIAMRGMQFGISPSTSRVILARRLEEIITDI